MYILKNKLSQVNFILLIAAFFFIITSTFELINYSHLKNVKIFGWILFCSHYLIAILLKGK